LGTSESTGRCDFGITDDQDVGTGIRKRQLFVFDTCKNFIDEFNSYRYDPEKNRSS
jgi:hypothetical protein